MTSLFVPLLRPAAAILVLCLPAAAGTTKVKSGLAADLQAAIDAAAPGDTILVSGGPYVGNFTVPAGKDGLRIKGDVFLDAHNGSIGIQVDSNDVLLSRLTIRHPGLTGIAGSGFGDPPLAGITLDRCLVLDSGSTGIEVFADDALIVECTTDGCEGGITVTGDRARVTRSKVLNDNGGHLGVTGDDAEITRCELTQIRDGLGINVTGSGARIRKNRVTDMDASAIFVDGGGGLVSGNTVEFTEGFGIDIVGDATEVSKNKVTGTQETAIRVVGLAAAVAGNKVRHVRDNGRAFEVSSALEARIEDNVAEFTGLEGYVLDVNEALVRGNKATRCGTADDAGFQIEGNANFVEGNVATSCNDSGFEVSGDANLLVGNKAIECIDNGFLVSGLGSVANGLVGCTARRNGGEGLENRGTGTVLEANTFLKNLLDLANATAAGATLVDDGGNSFKTGGLTTEPEI